MYIPKQFLMEDKAELLAFMRRFSFATIITSNNNYPTASQLPFVIIEEGDKIILLAHFAKANPQWIDLGKSTCLILFSEPHAYISPSHYDKLENVPTWNYISIHVYGEASLIEDKLESLKVLETTIETFEREYITQWNSLPADYRDRLLTGIIPFKIVVTEIQGKKKLSQNKSVVEQKRIIDKFSDGNPNEKEIAEYMKTNLTKEL
jgi:transcriptional regulator